MSRQQRRRRTTTTVVEDIDDAQTANVAAEQEAEIQSITLPNQTVIHGRPGAIAVRGSWLIHPDEVASCVERADGHLLTTVDGQSFVLSADEAAPFLPKPELKDAYSDGRIEDHLTPRL